MNNKFKTFNFLPGLVDSCPLNCIMCKYEHKNSTLSRTRLMDFRTWKKFLERVVKEKFFIKEFNLSFWGENPMHPEFIRFIEYAASVNKKHGIFERADMFTSGVFLSRKIVDAMLKLTKFSGLKLRYVVFGLDAYSEETYNKIRINGNFRKVVDIIKYFVRKRKELKVRGPKAVIEFLYQDSNRHELDKFIDYWKNFFTSENLPVRVSPDFSNWHIKKTDLLFIKRVDVWDNKKQAELTELHKKDLVRLGVIPQDKPKVQINDRYEPKVETPKLRKPCPALWQLLAMNYKGDFTSCCADFNCINNIGNVHKNTLQEVWLGEKITKLRIAHLIGYFEYSKLCARCKNQDGVRLTRSFYIRYLKYINREDIIPIFEERWKKT